MEEVGAEGDRPPGALARDSTSEIDRLFREHSARLRGLCGYILGSRDAAEDAVSEIYMRARQAHASYDPGQPFSAWIMSVARHHCFDLLRRRRVEGRLFAKGEIDADALPSAGGLGPGPLTRVLEEESRQALRAAIESLPRRYRLPLVLRYYEELTYDEIARELNLTRQSVATLLFRAKQKLRVAFDAGSATEGA
jgi:RNA polymerase sigma-70 factor (ECF subfamily)